MVTVIAYSNFRKELKSYMRKANEDADAILVTNSDPKDNIVVMGASDYDSLMETLHIYENPYLMDKVQRGLAQVKARQTIRHDLIEQEGE